jgi:hypothetical protein
VRTQNVFDVCLAQFRRLRAATGRGIAAVNLEKPSNGYVWRPEPSRAVEYVADFEKAVARALRAPDWKGRRKVFRIYFSRGIGYQRAAMLVGVSNGTFDYWIKDVKKAVGRECVRVGLYPPARYFHARTLTCAKQVPSNGLQAGAAVENHAD